MNQDCRLAPAADAVLNARRNSICRSTKTWLQQQPIHPRRAVDPAPLPREASTTFGSQPKGRGIPRSRPDLIDTGPAGRRLRVKEPGTALWAVAVMQRGIMGVSSLAAAGMPVRDAVEAAVLTVDLPTIRRLGARFFTALAVTQRDAYRST